MKRVYRKYFISGILCSVLFLLGFLTIKDLEAENLLTPVSAQEMQNLENSLEEFYKIKTSDSETRLMWLGKHKIGNMDGFASAGYLIKTSKNIILIDSASLLDDSLDKVEKIDVILVTHTHGDHFMPESTVNLQKKTGATVIANTAAHSMLAQDIPSESLYRIEPDTTREINFGSEDESKTIIVQSFLAEHPTKSPLVYLFEIDGFRIFHGADSGFVDSLNEINQDIHISLVPTGDPSPTASPQSAYQMVKAMNPIVAYTMHGSDTQSQEFVSLVNQDDSLKTRPVIPNQYQVMTPTEVVPEFPSTILIMIIGVFMFLVMTKYAKPNVLSKIVQN